MPHIALTNNDQQERRCRDYLRTKRAGAEFILPWAVDVFFQTLGAVKRRFSKSELRIVIEACRGWEHGSASGASELAQLIHAQCEANLIHLKHGVSRSLLEAKIGQLNDAQSLSLLVWAASFWNSQDLSPASLEAYAANV